MSAKKSIKSRVETERKSMQVEVTGVENEMDEGSTLITMTDLKGRIVYANEYFSRISEIPVSELIGKPHNIIRHPDMPRSAFHDMWQTLQSGRPWRGMVKNRASSGNHYWVDANVAPRVEKGEIVGYISVRRKPTREMINRAEALYANILNDKASFPYSDGKSRSMGQRFWIFVSTAITIPGVVWFVDLFNLPIWIGATTALAGSALLVTMALRLRSQLFTPMQEATAVAKSIATGDLRVSIRHDRNDELGELQKGLLHLLINTAGMLGQIIESSETLTSSSASLSETTQSLATGAEETSTQAITIAAAADEMNQTMQLLASSVEEMSITIAEVAKKAATAASIVQSANQSASRTSAVVNELGNSANEIGQVVESIATIASQTNLLALNASIEAAGAGSAGRGFAVVAGEVKELARQAGESSVEVKERIKAVQQQAEESVGHMNQIVQTFTDVKDISSSIASAVEEQSITSKEIAGNVSQVSVAAGDVAKNVNSIADVAKESARATETMAVMSGRLKQLASEMRSLTSKFRV